MLWKQAMAGKFVVVLEALVGSSHVIKQRCPALRLVQQQALVIVVNVVSS
jgi:hypothetical protein